MVDWNGTSRSAQGRHSGMGNDAPAIIRRSDKGLTIAGTRVTLYALMDYLREDWPHTNIREALNLSEEQLQVALHYIDSHRDDVETEYEEVVREAEERRRYWEERLHEHRASHPLLPPSSEQAELYARLAAQRAQTIRELVGEDAQTESQTARS